VKLPKTIIEKIDKEAVKEIKSRSSVLAKIIIENYELKEEEG
jgi:metal-responsive CopG/Arc/MetJ family transcriptional regulator